MMMLIAAASMLLAQDVENPQYKYWASCKVGSWAKLRMDMDRGGQKFESHMTYTLLELKEDVAVIEITGKSKVGAQEFPIPATKQEIKAKESADQVKIAGEGDEEIEVAGKKLKCRWYEYRSKSGDKETKGKVWMAKEIPGGTARMELGSPEGAKPMVMSTQEWEKK
jgi:hypothetical protein